jgi:hypothetical protein
LPNLAVFFFGIGAVDIIPDWSFVNRLVVVCGAEIEFVIDDALLPLAVL